MESNPTDFDSVDEGIYTADDVYGATSDFWGERAESDNPSSESPSTSENDSSGETA